MKKAAAVCGVLTVVFIIATVFFRKQMDSADLDYTEVKVQVVSSETKNTKVKTKYSSSTMTTYEVVVRYEGKEYDLKNAHNSYSYRKGATVTAYFSGGKMYANIEGIRTTSPMGIAYFVGLFGSFGLFFAALMLLAKDSDRKKKEKQAALAKAAESANNESRENTENM